MDWDDLGLSMMALEETSSSGHTEERETLNVRICGWTGMLAGGVLGGLVLLLLCPPDAPAGPFDLSMHTMNTKRLLGLILGVSGGIVFGAVVGKAVARRYFD